MKIQEVLLRAMAKKITWWQAAEILGFSDRHLRRVRERYEQFGYESMFDKRRGQPSPKRVPFATVEKVLALYRDQYFDFNVRHFHGHRAPAFGWNFHDYPRPPATGALQCGRKISAEGKNRRAQGYGKDARRKSPKTDFPVLLGNPAKCAGFPLSHSPGCGRRLNRKPDISLATKTGHFNLLPTGQRSRMPEMGL